MMPESVVYECSCPDYSEALANIIQRLDDLTSLFGSIEGFIIFFTVVVLCVFVYRFFRMFF